MSLKEIDGEELETLNTDNFSGIFKKNVCLFMFGCVGS